LYSVSAKPLIGDRRNPYYGTASFSSFTLIRIIWKMVGKTTKT
jgi:hypothetical protein